jgi:4'-phosphopantetheinyl transferase
VKHVLVDHEESCLAGGLVRQERTIGETTVGLQLLDLDAHAHVDEDLLPGDERDRMSRFRRDVDQCRFAARRLLLREVLGELVGLPSDTITFEHGAQGKPRLPASLGKGLEFNTSHSGRWFIVAWGFGAAIGVDIETDRGMRDGDSLARRWLTTTEHEEAVGHGLDFEGTGFLRLWCRKEAVMKATGLGLSLDPTSFEVPTDPFLDKPALVELGPPEITTLHLVDLDSGSWPAALFGSVCVPLRT